jgi:hypothetical protein
MIIEEVMQSIETLQKKNKLKIFKSFKYKKILIFTFENKSTVYEKILS